MKAPSFAVLNLRRNPFGELEPEERAALALPAVDLDAIAARLREPGYRVQFTGPSGSGKTTHLLALKARLPEAVYHRCGQAGRLPVARVLLLDEADRLPRGGVSSALACHEPFRDCSETVVLGPVSVDLASAAAAARIEMFRAGPGPLPAVPEARLAGLIERFRGDLRLVFSELYEDIQNGSL